MLIILCNVPYVKPDARRASPRCSTCAHWRRCS